MNPDSMSKGLFVGACALIAATVITAIVVLGSPTGQRKQRLDEVRVENLEAIQRLIISFAKLHKQLPDTFGALANEPGYSPPGTDPESGAVYEYQRLTEDTYRLCATFDASTYPRQDSDLPYSSRTWTHHAGRQCFDHRVDLNPAGAR